MERRCYWQSLTLQQRETCVGPRHESQCCSRYAFEIEGILKQDWEKTFQPRVDTLIENNRSTIYPKGGICALAIHLYLLSTSLETTSLRPTIVIRSGTKDAALRARKLLKEHILYQDLNTGFDIRIARNSSIYLRTNGKGPNYEMGHSQISSDSLFGTLVRLTTVPTSNSSNFTRATAGLVFHLNDGYYTTLPLHSCFPQDYFNPPPRQDGDDQDHPDWSDSDEEETTPSESDTVSEEENLPSADEQPKDVSLSKHVVYLDANNDLDAGWEQIHDTLPTVPTEKPTLVGHIRPQALGSEFSVRTSHPQLDCVLVKIEDSRFIGENKLTTPDGRVIRVDPFNVCREVPSSLVFIAAGVSGVCGANMSSSSSSILFPWATKPQRAWVMNFTLAPGDSGSFVVDQDGKLVGMAVASVPSANISYVIPAEDLFQAILPASSHNVLPGSTMPISSHKNPTRSGEHSLALRQGQDIKSSSQQPLTVPGHTREDEWLLDFSDSRQFLIEQFKNANMLWPLSRTDRQQSEDVADHAAFSEYVYRQKTIAQRECQIVKSTALLSLTQFDQWLWKFDELIKELIFDYADNIYSNLIETNPIDTSSLWRLAYLNVKLSIDSNVKLRATQRWMKELQRNLELLVNSIRGQIENNTNDINNVRTELTETFEPVLSLLKSSVVYLQRYYDDRDFLSNWSREMEPRRAETYEALTQTIRHLRDVTANNMINRSQETSRATDRLRLRTEPMDGVEKAIFPLSMLPPLRADHFTGREKNLENIHEWLGLQETPAIRTYTIYGRRGIGKTQIALEYVRKYRKRYDAVFWIQAESKGSLRQSFTDIAQALELPGADKNATFDENLVRVLRWLRHTQKRWLLIYDNAERAQLLKGYWPSGGSGAMLLTSRSYFNFFEDDQRHGETVQLFNDHERRQFFLSCLGEDWQSIHLNSEDIMVGIEEAAISALLTKTGGLPIAIRHAATMTVDTLINPTGTVRAFMEMFNHNYQNLPRRQISERDPLIQALDTIWNITFNYLHEPARSILSGLSLLAPDRVLIDLFLPSDQNLLTKKLEFCRATTPKTSLVQPGPNTSLQTVINPSPKLQEAINELYTKNLIKRTGRELSMHRTVQEAVNYQGTDELSDYFDAMVSLLFDAFPRQSEGRPLTEFWDNCRPWIQHVVTLALKYKAYTRNRPEGNIPLKGMKSAELFVKLLGNAAWYLFEIADYEEALNLVDIAHSAAQDEDSLDCAHLLKTAGVTYYELNKLRRARDALQACYDIRSRHLPDDHPEIADILSSLGNLETAEGNLEDAMEVLLRSAAIRESAGDDAATMLALNYLQIGRVYFLQENFTQAYLMYQKCEGILNKKVGRNKIFIANLHYAYGNLEFAQGQFAQAAHSYDLTRQISKEFNPMHPLTAAACYKLACTEYEQDNHKKALNYLSKALDIAELRGSSESDGMDGTVVRILFKRAEVLLDDPLGDRHEGTQLMTEVLFRQKDLAEKYEVDLKGTENWENREGSFDLLVPGYFR